MLIIFNTYFVIFRFNSNIFNFNNIFEYLLRINQYGKYFSYIKVNNYSENSKYLTPSVAEMLSAIPVFRGKNIVHIFNFT